VKWLAAIFAVVVAVNAQEIRFRGAPAQLVITTVSDRTVRIQLLPVPEQGQTIEGKSTSALLPITIQPQLTLRLLSDAKAINWGQGLVEVRGNPPLISLRRSPALTDLVQELKFEEDSVSFNIGGPLLGLGEGAQQFDRRGTNYTMEPSWGGWNRPIFGSVVPSPFLIGTEGWALFAAWPEGEFDLRGERGKFTPRKTIPASGGLDLFIVDAREPADALAEYCRLTGKPVMPPKWALGYMQSHRTLAGPEEPLQIAQTFREKKLPCDAVIYLGTGYCTNGWNTGHGSVNFNPRAFDRPAEMLRELHDLNFKVVLHVNRAPRNLFGLRMNERSDEPLHIRNYWARHLQTFAMGVDGWWPDDGDELPLEARLTRHRTYYEGPLKDRPGKRPWSLHRTGYAGSQRYGGWIWSGDIDGRWDTLAAQVSVGLNHGLSLTPFWGSDTGGFYPERDLTGELYARWFQFSTFCPSFRSHGRTWHLRLPWGWDTGEMGPIEHPDRTDRAELKNAAVEPICKKYLELRYRLLPYNYSVAREACDTGLPMMRALWLHYPNDPEAVKLGDEYLWGRDLLVAPVVKKGATSRRVYLPEGRWIDYWNGKTMDGKKWIDAEAPLDTIPLFVRAGAILPLDPVRQFTGQKISNPPLSKYIPAPTADSPFTMMMEIPTPARCGFPCAGKIARAVSLSSRANGPAARAVLLSNHMTKRGRGSASNFAANAWS
jgi:alpha-glucosidase (family GH31 glycosyl hydrolase)